MNLFRLPPCSLKTLFIIGMGGMLLLLVLMGSGIFFFQRSAINAFEKVEYEVLKTVHSLAHLQTIILRIEMPYNDYVMHGDPAERENFNRLNLELEEKFKETQTVLHVKEREMIRLAWKEWEEARPRAEALFALPNPVGDRAAVAETERLDAQIDHIAEIIAQAHDTADQEVIKLVESARILRGKLTLFSFSILGVGTFLIIVGFVVLARSVLVPMRILEEGANYLGSGRLSHRVVLDNQNETGTLAKVFNSMAEKIEQTQEKLRDLSVRDSLTGLYNHREFQRRLSDETKRCLRYNRPFSLLMLDIDHFKAVNDAYGHPAGDEVLRSVAAMIGKRLRTTDQPARYGGEEFAVILLEMQKSDAQAAAERICGVISEKKIVLGHGQTINITVSVGIAAFPEDARSERELLARADQALYTAKRAGRNRVCAYQPQPEKKRGAVYD